MTRFVEVETVRRWLADGDETAFLGIREEGQRGSGHPLLAVKYPLASLRQKSFALYLFGTRSPRRQSGCHTCLAYLRWERELPAQIAGDVLARFRSVA